MKLTEATAIIVDQLNLILPQYMDKIHAMVDSRKMWDGRIDLAKFTHTERKGYRNGTTTKEANYIQKLSFGAFTFSVRAAVEGSVESANMLNFEYQVPCIGRYDQPLYKNSISRGTWDGTTFQTEIKLRKFVTSKIKSLVERIEEWHTECTHANFALYQKNKAANTNTYYFTAENGAYSRALMEHTAILRLIAGIHNQRAPEHNIQGTDRIVQLVEMLSDEVMAHIRANPELDGLTLRET